METKHFWIQKLECIFNNTQGTDEYYLDVYLDGIQQPSLRMILSAGQSWSINEYYTFKSQVKAKLSFQNFRYNDDFSEIVTLQTKSSSEILTVSFNLGNGFYKLFYKISLDQQGLPIKIGDVELPPLSEIGDVHPVPTPGPFPPSGDLDDIEINIDPVPTPGPTPTPQLQH